MKALLVCATFGRIPYLPTMLAGFLNQNYDDKHLVVINDDVNVELCCDYDNVTVINCNKRLLLSEKRNLGIASGYHDIIFPYDDDDIFLPERVSNHMKEYLDSNVDAFRNVSAYFTYDGVFKKDNGPPNDLSFRKNIWFNIGGYNNINMIGEDVELYNKITRKKIVDDDVNIDFVYGWSGVNYHLSAGQTKEFINRRAYAQLKELDILNKKYWIIPDHCEYEKYLKLVSIYEKNKVDIPIKHVKMGELDISHLL